MKRSLTIYFFLFNSLNIYSQNVLQPHGGGVYNPKNISDEITPEQRTAIIKMLQSNEQKLREQGLLTTPQNPTVTAFEWPLRQAINNNDNGYYGISNYVDENPAFPNQLLDYNCGTRTYDQASGYNHKGTDIFTWPWPWQKMNRNAVEVIAGAPGTIISKTDGNFDQNCAFCSGPCTWNAIYVMHADGSVAWYGHLKSGTLNPKTVGQTVSSGEYLGVVGSSGNSTGPHLHLEVYTNSSYTQLVDPWNGPCNSMNPGVSWWANQQPYYVPTLIKVMTHGVAPASGSCPAGEVSNEKINFASANQIFFSSYYRDQQAGQQAVHTVYRPDGTVWNTWVQNFTQHYNASWWYYSFTLNNPATTGIWRYEIVFNGNQKATHYFTINESPVVICRDSYNVLTSNLTGSISYQWQVNPGTGYVNLVNGAIYSGVNTRFLQLSNIPSSFYGYQYRCVVDGANFSQVIPLKITNYWKGSVSKAWENPANWSCGNVPDLNTDVVVQTNTNTPEVSSNVACRTLRLENGGVVTVKTGFNLEVKK